MDLGESLAQAAVRETMEESGIDCEITGLSGIYTDPGHVILYTSNGEVRQEFSIVLTARATGGQPTPSSETSEVRWVAVSDLGGYQMDQSMRLRVQHYPSTAASPTSARPWLRPGHGRRAKGASGSRARWVAVSLRVTRSDRAVELRRRAGDGAADGMLRAVAGADVGQALLDGHVLAVRAGGHVAVDQRVGQIRGRHARTRGPARRPGRARRLR